MSELNLPRAAEAQAPGVNLADESSDDDDARTMYAVVDGSGTLARGRSAVSAARLRTGAYEVVFRKDVRRSAYLGTSGCPVPRVRHSRGEITVVGRSGNDRGILAMTHSSGGAPADLGFHLAVLGLDDD